MKAIYFFCVNEGEDPVAPHVYRHLATHLPLRAHGISFDGHEITSYVKEDTEYLLVPTEKVLSHALPHYLPLLQQIGEIDFGGIVNWHAGANAPDQIFCLHTNGDVPSSVFPITDARAALMLFRSLEASRTKHGLTSWRTLPEATHFSGVPYGVSPELLEQVPFPLFDIEIGSDTGAYQNRDAIAALSEALITVHKQDSTFEHSLLFVGGTHFEPSLAEALQSGTVAFSHILPNQWLTKGGYDGEEAVMRLKRAVTSVREGVSAVVFHDSLKGIYKTKARELAVDMSLPTCHHRQMRGGALPKTDRVAMNS